MNKFLFYLGVLLIVCDSEAIREYEDRKLGRQLWMLLR